MKIKFEEGITIRNVGKAFEEQIKKTDYKSDITVSFGENASFDLAGIQALGVMKKEAKALGGSIEFENLPKEYERYIEV